MFKDVYVYGKCSLSLYSHDYINLNYFRSVRSFLHSFVCSFVRLFVRSFFSSFVSSFVRFLVRSFLHSFVCSFVRFLVRSNATAGFTRGCRVSALSQQSHCQHDALRSLHPLNVGRHGTANPHEANKVSPLSLFI